MKYQVNENCIGCELCADICPEVFSMGEDGFSHASEEDVPDSCKDSAKEAMDSCPSDAIEEVS